MTAGDSSHIFLLGAGHANLLAVRALRQAVPQARIILVDAAAEANYSGMFPGVVAGHYPADAMRIPLRPFAERNRIAFVQSRIAGLDPVARRVSLEDGTVLAYDVAALNVGSHSAMPEIPGFAAHGIAIKPLDGFTARLQATDPTAAAALIGGGVAGAEIALALRHRGARAVTVIEAGPDPVATLRPRSRRYVLQALERAGIRVVTGAQVAAVQPDAVLLANGSRIASTLTVGIAGARAHGWMARTLPLDGAGFVRVTPALEVEGHPSLFAAGDCAAMVHAPRSKAGVFAVRQAPVLAANMAAALSNAPLRTYAPQEGYLKIISLGQRSALAEWRGMTLRGAWLWRFKDHIDRRFMAGFQR